MRRAPIIWRWWDQGWVGGGAAVSALVAGAFLLSPGDSGPPYEALWTVGLLLLAAGLGIRAARLEKADPPSRLDVASAFLENWLTWRVVAIGAGGFLLLLIVLAINRPWDPLSPCTRSELAEKYTDHKCLARAANGRYLPWDEGRGEVVVRDSGRLNEVDLTIVEPTFDTYDYRYKPVTGWLLSLLAVASLILSISLKTAEKRRLAAAAAQARLTEMEEQQREADERRRRAKKEEKKRRRAAARGAEAEAVSARAKRGEAAPPPLVEGISTEFQAASLSEQELRAHIGYAAVAEKKSKDGSHWRRSREIAEEELARRS